MKYYNSLVDPEKAECQVNAETNTIELRRALRAPYRFGTESMIEFSIENIKMPSSSRPTGTYQLGFYSKIGE